MSVEVIPRPGSHAATLAGCRCPRSDNRYGAGAYVGADEKPVFYVDESCKLHGPVTAGVPLRTLRNQR